MKLHTLLLLISLGTSKAYGSDREAPSPMQAAREEWYPKFLIIQTDPEMTHADKIKDLEALILEIKTGLMQID